MIELRFFCAEILQNQTFEFATFSFIYYYRINFRKILLPIIIAEISQNRSFEQRYFPFDLLLPWDFTLSTSQKFS